MYPRLKGRSRYIFLCILTAHVNSHATSCMERALDTFTSPEAALLLVSTKNRDLWQVQHRKSAIHGLPVTLRMFRVKSDKSDWFCSQSIVFTKPFKTGMSLERRWSGPELAILGADQKERGLWGREWHWTVSWR